MDKQFRRNGMVTVGQISGRKRLSLHSFRKTANVGPAVRFLELVQLLHHTIILF